MHIYVYVYIHTHTHTDIYHKDPWWFKEDKIIFNSRGGERVLEANGGFWDVI